MRALQERWVLALATLAPDDGLPYATPLFYAVAALPGCLAPILVFASRADTCHGRALAAGPTAVAAAIYLETETVGEIRGVQLRGEVVVCTRLRGDASGSLRAAYLERHPVAAAHLGERDLLYALAIDWAKLTDNRIGYGKRLVWTFEPAWRGRIPAGPGEETALR
jgi:uncharacterized protein YhbP (UPF0306 family)